MTSLKELSGLAGRRIVHDQGAGDAKVAVDQAGAIMRDVRVTILPGAGSHRLRRSTLRRLARFNHAGLDHLQISIDNVTPDDTSKKSLTVLDAKLQMMVCALEEDTSEGPVTSKRNPLGQQFYRGTS